MNKLIYTILLILFIAAKIFAQSNSGKCFLKALELNPNSAMAHQYYAFLLSNLGYSKKAVKKAELAQQLDPLNAPISAMLAFNYYNVNMLDESLEQYEKQPSLILSFMSPGAAGDGFITRWVI